MQLVSTRFRCSSWLDTPSRSRTRFTTRASPMYSTIDQRIVEDAVAWCHMNGLVVGAGDGVEDVSVVHAPVSLFPTPFPQKAFQRVQNVMPELSKLVHAVSEDMEYVNETLSTAAQFDSFTKSLLDVHSKTAEARAQNGSPIALGLHRSDYMLDEPSGNLLQVELNTIASSFAALSTQVEKLHSYVLERYPDSSPAAGKITPDQRATQGFIVGLSKAHEAFCDLHSLQQNDCLIVMVVQPGERNAFDQRWIQLEVWKRSKIDIVRLSLAEIAEQGVQDDKGHMRIGGKVVSVFYLRAGYTPDDYVGGSEWLAREAMESCTAVSCPSVAYQLVGAKKIQQDLAAPGRLERFVPDEAVAKEIRGCFAGLWSLDDPSEPTTAAVIQDAISKPHNYVLKPQREGGDEELAEKLTAGGESLASYILMQRIKPKQNSNVLVRKGKASVDQTLTEVGVYGMYLRVGSEVKYNYGSGLLVRTKTANSNEGGVAAGFAVLDSVYFESDTG